MHAKYVDSAWN